MPPKRRPGTTIDSPHESSGRGGTEGGSVLLQTAQSWQNSTAATTSSAAIISPNGYIAFSDLLDTAGGSSNSRSIEPGFGHDVCSFSAANNNNSKNNSNNNRSGDKQKAKSASSNEAFEPVCSPTQPRHISLQPAAPSTDKNNGRRIGLLGCQNHNNRGSRLSTRSAPFLSPAATRPCSISAAAAISATVSSPAVSSLKVSSVTAAGAFSPPADALALLTGSTGQSPALPPPATSGLGVQGRRFSRPLSYLSLAAIGVVIPAAAAATAAASQLSTDGQHSHARPIPDGSSSKCNNRPSSTAYPCTHHSLPSTATAVRRTQLSPSLDRVQIGSIRQPGLSRGPSSGSSTPHQDTAFVADVSAIVCDRAGRGVDGRLVAQKGIICSAVPEQQKHAGAEDTRNQRQCSKQAVTAHAGVFGEPACRQSANNVRRTKHSSSSTHACANTTETRQRQQQRGQTLGSRSFSLNTQVASRDAAAAQAANFSLSSDDHMCQAQGPPVQSEACGAAGGSDYEEGREGSLLPSRRRRRRQLSTSSRCCCATCINQPDRPRSVGRMSLVSANPSVSCSAFPPQSTSSLSSSSSSSSLYFSTSNFNMVSNNVGVPHRRQLHNAVTVLPPDHPIMVTLAKRNSVFYRRPKSTTREQPAIEEEADLCSLQSRETDGPSAGASDKGYVPSDNDDNDDDDNGSGHGQAAADGDNNNDTSNLDLDTVDSCKRNDVGLGVNSGDEGLTREQQSELALRLALCRELPYWCCHFTADTREFLYSHQPYGAERPATEPAPPMVFSSSPSDFYPPTPEIVDSMVEYLMLMFHINTCSAVIPMERRLPDIREFIWRLLDGTMIDLWTAIACVILLRRYYRIQNHCVDAPYGAAHSLFLGIFMLASTQCVYTNNPELISLPSIVGILDSHYQVDDLVRIRREVFANIHYRTWISEEDIRSHAKNNLFDIYRVKSAYSFYKERQEQRMMIKEEERRQEVRRQNLVARLERFMHRTPHDSLGSWNTKTMYCTESRFLFRHLPWFPGMVTPIHVTARSEQAKLYNYPDKFPPVFSPLLPPTRSRITGTTN